MVTVDPRYQRFLGKAQKLSWRDKQFVNILYKCNRMYSTLYTSVLASRSFFFPLQKTVLESILIETLRPSQKRATIWPAVTAAEGVFSRAHSPTQRVHVNVRLRLEVRNVNLTQVTTTMSRASQMHWLVVGM